VYRKQTFPLFGHQPPVYIHGKENQYSKKVRAVAEELYHEKHPDENVKGKLELFCVDTDGDTIQITNEDELVEAGLEFSPLEVGRKLRIFAHKKA
jgi:hypothetical protein